MFTKSGLLPARKERFVLCQVHLRNMSLLQEGQEQIVSSISLCFVAYSDVLLMIAEAENEKYNGAPTRPWPKRMPREEVRDRAGISRRLRIQITWVRITYYCHKG